jgi:H+/Cl- antiporter ClcA
MNQTERNVGRQTISLILTLSAIWAVAASLWLTERFFYKSAHSGSPEVADIIATAGRAMQIYLWPAVILCGLMTCVNLWTCFHSSHHRSHS